MEKIGCTDRVRYEEVKEKRDIIHTVKRRKANWIGNITDGKIGVTEATRRQGTRRRQTLDDPKQTTGILETERGSSRRTLWKTRFGRRY
jgi:hypothetical protein